MRVLLASLGTAGDVHPFLAIGRALVARGHAVELLSNPVFAGLAREAGIGFTAVGTEEHYRAAFAHHYIWHPVNGFGVMWRYLARPALPGALARIETARTEGPCVVLFSPFLMPAARIAAEAHGVPAVAAYTAPAMLPNFRPPLCLTSLRIPGWIPRRAARAAVEWLDRRKMQPLALPAIDAARSVRGLAPLRRSVFLDWLHGDGGGIALFPDWFAAPSPDWPADVCQAGFPLWDGDANAGLAPQLEAFLRSGDPPVVITGGTAMAQAGRFFARSVEACRALGLRAILLAQDGAQIPRSLPPGIQHFDYAPFGLLLPRARALVHHGGIGSTAQALRAGIAQLVVPQAYDQFDNAMRIVGLGVGLQLDARAGAAGLRRALRRVAVDPAMGARAAALAQRIRPGSGVGAVIERLERLA